MKKWIAFALLLVISLPLVSAVTLKGTIYNSDLEPEQDVMVEIDGQKFLAKDGHYQFDLPTGKYTITAYQGLVSTTELVSLKQEHEFTLDFFLLPDFIDETDLWSDTDFNVDVEDEKTGYAAWRYAVAGLVILLLLWRVYAARKKYGPLRSLFKKKENKKETEESKIVREDELELVLDALRKNQGRMHQKQLRRELLHLSETKVSLILTELEHKGKIEKIKKGRGNVILLKEDNV